MGIAEIIAMRVTLQKMQEMKDKVSKDINKDINKKRKAALKEIREYLNELADALDGVCVEVEFENGMIFDPYYRGQCLKFWSKYPTSRGGNSYKFSDDPVNWHITCYEGYKTDADHYYLFIDKSNQIERARVPQKWADGFIELIEKWETIKPIIEKSVQASLSKKMKTVQEETQEKITSYEKVADFEV